MLVDDEEHLRVVAVRGSRLARDARVKLGESIAGRVARSREPLLINGVVTPNDYPGYADREHTTSSAMCVPLVNRGQLLGVLNISAPADRQFDEYDMQVLSLFAEPVAAAIAKAGLYEAERAARRAAARHGPHEDPVRRIGEPRAPHADHLDPRVPSPRPGGR